MANAPVAFVEPNLTLPDKTTIDITDIVGVAIFDLIGLPREYFVTEKNPSTDWVQLVFQALGLRSLLSSSLELDGFRQITINLEATTAMVVRRRQDYIALQFEGRLVLDNAVDEERLSKLIDSLDSEKLRQHPHFSQS